MFRVLAVEEPDSQVLNYAPGPLDTPMIEELLADEKTDPGIYYNITISPKIKTRERYSDKPWKVYIYTIQTSP